MQLSPHLALGTAQFGSPYGITCRGNGPSESEVQAILARAAATGVTTVDTAAAYGPAEQRIGYYTAAAQSSHPLRIVTKLPPDSTGGEVASAVQRSMERLGVSYIHGIMVHRAKTLLEPGGEAVWRSLVQARDGALVGRLGVSVYTPEELAAVRARYSIDLVQLPFNLYDRRFQGIIEDLVAAGVEVHLRSALMQGLLAVPADALPPFLTDLVPDQQRFFDLTAAYGARALAGALALCAAAGGHRIVIGCQSVDEFEDLIAARNEARTLPEELVLELLDFGWAKPAVIVDPRFWPT